MKAEAIFHQIVYVDAVLSMGGIIPSVSIFHSKMQALIQRLERVLNAQSSPPEQVRCFCLLVCQLLDRRIAEILSHKHNAHLQGLSLAQALYGELAADTAFEVRLNRLLETSTGDIFALSKGLLAWLSTAKAGNEQVELLAATWEAQPLGNVVIEASAAASLWPASSAIRERAILPLVWAFLLSALIFLWLYLKAY